MTAPLKARVVAGQSRGVLLMRLVAVFCLMSMSISPIQRSIAGPLDWPSVSGPQGDGSTTVWNLPVSLDPDHQTNVDSSWQRRNLSSLPALISMNSRIYGLQRRQMVAGADETSVILVCYTVEDGERYWATFLPQPIADRLLHSPEQLQLLGDPLWRQVFLVTPTQLFCWNSENGTLLWTLSIDQLEMLRRVSSWDVPEADVTFQFPVQTGLCNALYWQQSLFVPLQITAGNQQWTSLLAIDRRRGKLEWVSQAEASETSFLPQILLGETQERPVVLLARNQSQLETLCTATGKRLSRLSLPEGSQLQQLNMVIRRNRLTSPHLLPEQFPAVVCRVQQNEQHLLQLISLQRWSEGFQAVQLWSAECAPDSLVTRSDESLIYSNGSAVLMKSLKDGSPVTQWTTKDAQPDNATIVSLRFADHRVWTLAQDRTWRLGEIDQQDNGALSLTQAQSGQLEAKPLVPLIFANTNAIVLLDDRMLGISNRLPGETSAIIADDLRTISSREFREARGEPATLMLVPEIVELYRGQQMVLQPRVYDEQGRFVSLANTHELTVSTTTSDQQSVELQTKPVDGGIELSIPLQDSFPSELILSITSKTLNMQATAKVQIKPLQLTDQVTQ